MAQQARNGSTPLGPAAEVELDQTNPGVIIDETRGVFRITDPPTMVVWQRDGAKVTGGTLPVGGTGRADKAVVPIKLAASWSKPYTRTAKPFAKEGLVYSATDRLLDGGKPSKMYLWLQDLELSLARKYGPEAVAYSFNKWAKKETYEVTIELSIPIHPSLVDKVVGIVRDGTLSHVDFRMDEEGAVMVAIDNKRNTVMSNTAKKPRSIPEPESAFGVSANVEPAPEGSTRSGGE